MFGGKFGGATTGNVHVDTANNRTIIGIYISGESMIVTKRKKETIAAAVQRKIESEEPGAKLERLDLGSESVSRDAPAAPAAVSMPGRRPRRVLFEPSQYMQPGELARMQGSQTTGRRRGPPHVPNGRPMFGRTPRRRPETPPAAAEECAICLEDLDDASPALACGHKFCNECYSKYLCHKITDEGHECVFARCPEAKCPLVITDPLVRSLVVAVGCGGFYRFSSFYRF